MTLDSIRNSCDVLIDVFPSYKMQKCCPIAVHNVLFVQYDSPVSKIDPCLLQGYIRHGAIIMPVSTTGHGRHGAILWGTRGYILGEIADLEFEIHKNEKKCIFLPIEQAGTNIC